MGDYAIEMLNITKRFSGVVANDGITLRLKKGEIHAILGENGAGKSTLMSVLFGLYPPDGGEIRRDGVPVRLRSPNDAAALGIGMVHQHFRLVARFSVLDNIILGAETTRGPFLRRDEARRRVAALSERYGLRIEPDAQVEEISVGMQQRTEILKMLYRDSEVLIFDEPTAVLTPQETGGLMQIMKGLAAEGKSILFITHKLNEIKAVADRCTVLRGGRCAGTVDVGKTSQERLSEMMVGRRVRLAVQKKPMLPGESVLTVHNLIVKGRRRGRPPVNDVSFHVRRGEIVCIAGVDGNGQSELIGAIAGLLRADGGQIFLNGEEITRAPVRRRIRSGMSYIPEDRHRHGLLLDASLEENLLLKRYAGPPFSRHGFLQFGEIRRHAQALMDRFDVRSGQGPAATVRGLSGGNQQKAIIAREIDWDGDLLIAVQPTRGLDIGAMEYVRRALICQRDAGKAVLLVSLDMDEVLDMSDRILVMFEGAIAGELDPRHTAAGELGLYMAGARRSGREGGERL